jgi:nanoRNase/pAp phosphatase (c-di-AMP/oligoRNAs hydrolase)
MKKVRISSSIIKRRIIGRFLDVMASRESFLMAGHSNPDEDCVSSMVAFSLLMVKFGKPASMVLSRENWEKFPYLLNICKYNSIRVLGTPGEIEDDYDTIIVFDTPKPAMVDFLSALQPLMSREEVVVMEIDHHLEADGTYIGDEPYRLVDEASSTCELIGYLALKLQKRRGFVRRNRIGEIFTRNFVLSIVTGIVGDSKMGQFLKSNREKRYYRYFSRLFNQMLIRKTDKESGNFSSIEDILAELDRLSGEEEACYQEFYRHRQLSGPMAWVALDEAEMEPVYARFDYEIIVTVAKYTANMLAEESGFVSLVAFYDSPEHSNLIQMRMRRSQSFKNLDLRQVIARLEVVNGGGHEGAVGFRIPRDEVEDFRALIDIIVEGTVEMIGER